MKIVADLHTHTLASDHAYSTVKEMCQSAFDKGLSAIAITDHGPRESDAPHEWHFRSMRMLPRVVCGVTLLRGVELNILDDKGTVDLPEQVLQKMDYVIASCHESCYEPVDRDYHTRAWLAVLENPLVDCLGHMGNANYDFDQEPVIARCAEKGKIVEINSHSFRVRRGSAENCRSIARLCKKYGVRVALTSDAHFFDRVGEVEASIEVLEEVGFPEELVVNTSVERLKAFFMERRGLDLDTL